MDFNKKIDELVIKYGIDKFHPRFGKRFEAKVLINQFFSNSECKSCVLLAEKKIDYAYLCEDCDIASKRTLFLYEELQNNFEQLKQAEAVVVVSFFGRREIKSQLHNQGIETTLLYDYLAENGVILDANYYDVFGEENYSRFDGKASFEHNFFDMNSVFFYDRRNYELANHAATKGMYLLKMIFDCIYVRDWQMTFRYIDEYCNNHYDGWTEVKKFRNELEHIIAIVRTQLHNRQAEDIIVFWLDSLEYGEDEDMPFMQSAKEQSVDFSNAYTVTPYTHSSAKALFNQKRVVDEQSYRHNVRKDAEFIQTLENKGYRFVFHTFLGEVDEALKGKKHYNIYTSMTEICWDMVVDLLNTPQRVCAVVHEVYATHAPYLSFGLKGEDYIHVRENVKVYTQKEKQQLLTQQKQSREYVDNVLEFYNGLLPSSACKVYLSDHGHTSIDKWHTILRIAKEGWAPKTISGMFSNVNFDKIIYGIINNRIEDYKDVVSEYVGIQDIDYYAENLIKLYLYNDSFATEGFWGYKGLIDKNYIYIKHRDGRERYFNNIGNHEKITEKSVDHLRQQCKPYPADIIKDEKFRATRNFVATYHNYMKRKGDWEEAKQNAIYEIFDNLPDNAKIAIRGGGKHTLELWFALKERHQGKIDYVIDKDKACIASRLGLEVLDIAEVEASDIEIVVISSFQKEEEWYNEIQNLNPGVQVVPFYRMLKEKGINCTHEFFKKKFSKEDIVWEE